MQIQHKHPDASIVKIGAIAIILECHSARVGVYVPYKCSQVDEIKLLNVIEICLYLIKFRKMIYGAVHILQLSHKMWAHNFFNRGPHSYM